jgi:hypothetical protein
MYAKIKNKKYTTSYGQQTIKRAVREGLVRTEEQEP